MNRSLIVLGVALLVVLYQIGAETERAPAQAESLAPTEGWEADLLAAIGNTAPTNETISYLDAWQRAERGTAAFNWLNTTQNATGATNYNSVGVKNYPDYQTGIQAIAETLTNGRYPNTLAGLQSNAPVVDDAEMETWGTGGGALRAQLAQAPQAAQSATGDTRAQVVALALAQVGKPYVLGASGPETFDCSGLIQWSYGQFGIATTRTTFSQLDALRPIAPDQIQTGDMVYFQYPWDQHAGILADVDNDGTWDMIHAAAPSLGVIVTNNVFSDPFYANAIIGYRTAL